MVAACVVGWAEMGGSLWWDK